MYLVLSSACALCRKQADLTAQNYQMQNVLREHVLLCQSMCTAYACRATVHHAFNLFTVL